MINKSAILSLALLGASGCSSSSDKVEDDRTQTQTLTEDETKQIDDLNEQGSQLKLEVAKVRARYREQTNSEVSKFRAHMDEMRVIYELGGGAGMSARFEAEEHLRSIQKAGLSAELAAEERFLAVLKMIDGLNTKSRAQNGRGMPSKDELSRVQGAIGDLKSFLQKNSMVRFPKREMADDASDPAPVNALDDQAGAESGDVDGGQNEAEGDVQ